MPPSAASVRSGFRGRVELEVARVAGASTVIGSRATAPLKILTPRSRGPSVWAYVSSLGGGMVSGDEYDVQVRLGEGAAAFVGTQASTKIYKSPDPDRSPCGQTTRAEVGKGGLLVWTPDPVQPFAGSRFRQRQEFHLADGAGLVLLDSVTAGRSERGEHWAFSEYASRSEVWVEGRRLVLDAIELQSDPGRLTVGQRMGSCQIYAVLMIVGAELEGVAQTLLARVSALPARTVDGLRICGSAVPGGGLFRLASPRVEPVRRCLTEWLSVLEGRLGDNPWARKW